MTVQELIEELKKYKQDMEVCVCSDTRADCLVKYVGWEAYDDAYSYVIIADNPTDYGPKTRKRGRAFE